MALVPETTKVARTSDRSWPLGENLLLLFYYRNITIKWHIVVPVYQNITQLIREASFCTVINTEIHQLDNMERVISLRALSPKWDVFKPIFSKLWNLWTKRSRKILRARSSRWLQGLQRNSIFQIQKERFTHILKETDSIHKIYTDANQQNSQHWEWMWVSHQFAIDIISQ